MRDEHDFWQESSSFQVRLIHGVLKQHWSNGMTRSSQDWSEGSIPSCCTSDDPLVKLAREYAEATYISPTPSDYMIIQNAMIHGYLLAVEKIARKVS